VKYETSVNVSENTPSDVKNADHYYISKASESQWETTHQKTFDEIPESGDGDKIPRDELLLPVPNGENLKIRYEKEKIEYEKLNFSLDATSLAGDYEDDTVETNVWKQKGRQRLANKIDASKLGIPTYVFSILFNFVVVGLWGGSIVTLILMLPIVAIDDYIFAIPDAILGFIAFVIFWMINAVIMWDSVVDGRYKFKI
jgi:hypothetical protein